MPLAAQHTRLVSAQRRACPWMSALLKAPDDNAFAGVRITLQRDKQLVCIHGDAKVRARAAQHLSLIHI